MKKIIIFLGITINLFSAADNKSRLFLQEQISNILSQSKTADTLNAQLVKLELSGDKVLKQIIERNALQTIYYYLQNKFPRRFSFEDFKKDAINKGPLYDAYLKPIIFITKNLKLNELNKLLIASNIDININYYEAYVNYNIENIISWIFRAPKADKNNYFYHLMVLLQMGLVNSKNDSDGNTAIAWLLSDISSYFVGINYINYIKLLIDNGAEVNIKNNDGSTALMLASCYMNGAVELLIKCGADINLKDNQGNTALMLACLPILINPQVIYFLSRSGAIKEYDLMSTSCNCTPPCECSENMYRLAKSEANSYIENNRNNIVELLINAGANINLQNDRGNTALMLASLNGHTDIVKLLVDNGADINIINNKNKTALMLASDKGHKEILKLLKEQDTSSNCVIQ